MKRMDNKLSLSEYEILAMEAFKTDDFLILNKKLIRSLGLVSAAIMANYIDKDKYFRSQYPENRGWFFLTYKDQQELLNIGLYSLKKTKTFLINKNILITKRQGVPAKEWYRINYKKLIHAIGLVDTKSSALVDTKSSALYKKNKYKKNKYKEYSESKNSDKKPPIRERNKQYIPICERLDKIIQSHKNIKHTPSQLKSWSNEIRKLTEENGVPTDRIHKALDWYEKNIGRDEYVVVIQSGSSLRNKFIQLENAIERDSQMKSYNVRRGEQGNGHRELNKKYPW